MKSLFTVFFFLMFVNSSFTQRDKYVSFELAGSGGLASFNYELSLFKKPRIRTTFETSTKEKFKYKFNWRFGISVAPIDKNNGVALVFPIMVHGVFGQKQHKLDVGIGQAITITTKGNFFFIMPASIGYRFQPIDKRYYLRLSYTPIISYLVNFQWQNWAGITFGYKLPTYAKTKVDKKNKTE